MSCSICYENYSSETDRFPSILIPCGHTFCRSCVAKFNASCPTCRQPIVSHCPNYSLINDDTSSNAPVTNISVSPINYQMVIKDNLVVIDGVLKKVISFMAQTDESVSRPINIITLVDVSGSMSLPSTTDKGEGGSYSRLDLIKQALRYVASGLSSHDSLCIMAFSESTKIVFESSSMTSQEIARAITLIDKLSLVGGTYIYPALQTAFKKAAQSNDHTAIILMTDGENTDDNVYSPTLKIVDFVRSNVSKINCKVSAIGFGSAIPAEFLHSIAIAGRGIFSYSHDLSMLATVFHYVMVNEYLSIKPCANVTIDDKVHQLGDLRANIPFYLVLDKTDPCHIEFDGHSYDLNNTEYAQDDVTAILNYTSFINGIVNRSSNRSVETLYSNLQSLQLCDKIQAIMDDLKHEQLHKGQIQKALDNMSSWGFKHIVSTCSQLQSCTAGNFKDNVPNRYYTSSYFQSMVDAMCDICKQLPIPSPTINATRYVTASNYATRASTMSAMYDADGACISGDCNVVMADGICKPMSQLRKGDVLSDDNVVACITRSIGNYTMYCKDGLKLTAYHPFIVNNAWTFPIESNYDHIETASQVYNIVLEPTAKPWITIKGSNDMSWPVITLGHELTDGIAVHPYFGSVKCIDD